MEKYRVLFVASDIAPYQKGEFSSMATQVREMIERMYDRGNEIRNFMPKYGYINERRHQLHEVIRLSGINIIVNGSDQPLIIKVASIPQIRVQVYFIDSEEFFSRKAMFWDENGQLFSDNDERLLFFCKGALDSVKKLGWAPDIVMCSGWFSALVPYYVKTELKDHPLFAESKVVFALFDEDRFEGNLPGSLAVKSMDFPNAEQPAWLSEKCGFRELVSCAAHYSDAITLCSPGVEQYLLNASQIKDKLYYPKEEENTGDFIERVFGLVLEGQSILSE
ncbi:MAG: glycogen/starch synthase [Flavobacteriales bacterium]|nr:glycogen/starch synthase [Flavobacteriales bacterium]MDW8410154.1 glycogen/starch synthase [Flavobacteriales bacterium]